MRMSIHHRTPRRFTILWPLALMTLWIAAPAPAQVILIGTVLEEDGLTPIPVADVRLLGPTGGVTATTISDDEGRFRLEAESAGEYSITVRRLGFVTVSADSIQLAEEDPTEIRVLLGMLAVPLEAVTVIARQPYVSPQVMRFRDRAARNDRMGRGRIYMRADIDRLRPYSADDLLRGVLWGASCRPVIMLDGLPVDGSLHMITGDNLEGVEIYRRATQIPAEFYRPGMCGLALVWRRSDPPGAKPFTWRRAIIAGAIVFLIGLASF